jgi:uncharacterized alpha-E superfamily protein
MLEELIYDRQSVTGVLASCMSHDVAWQFIGLGEHIERADMTTRILDIQSAVMLPQAEASDPAQALLWVGVLNSLSALQMYRRHAANAGSGDGGITGDSVVQYLITDEHFPRSVAFSLDALESHLAELPHNMDPLRAMRVAQRRVDRAGPPELGIAGRHDFLDAIQGDLARIHDAIASEYFHLHQRETALGVAV